MSSLFRARRTGGDERGSGGKLVRARRPAPSPYARPPESSPSPAAAALSGSPRWLTGLISGAGKLISSVLPVYRSSSSPSTGDDYSSDEELSSDGNVDEEENWRLDQGGNQTPPVGPLAIVPRSETKCEIQQMLMQETFTREECDKLTKLIQSRVVDFSSPVFGNRTRDLGNRSTVSDTLPGSFSSFSQKKRTFSESVPHSSSRLNSFSPEPSLFEACTPDICNKAVSEAKKWLEEKKLTSKPKYDSECGPCILNTDMLHYGFEGDGGSPVDMAKSYMRSLPPWRSPTFSGIGFKTPPPSGILRYKDETFYETANLSVPSAKTREEVGGLTADDTLTPASQLVGHDEKPSSEIRVPPKENTESAVRSAADEIADLNNVCISDKQTSDKHTSAGVEGTTVSDSSSEFNPACDIAETNCISDSREHDESSHMPKEENGLVCELATNNGSSTEVDTNSNHETPCLEPDKSVPQNGTTMKSIGRMLGERQVTTARRGKKVVTRARRGRKS